MAPRQKADLVYIHFTYIPVRDMDTKYVQIFLQYENQRLSDFVVTYRYWLEQIMNYEKGKLPSNSDVRFTEWRIISNNADLFTIYNKRFEKVLLILGEEFVYWTFYFHGSPTQKRIQGKGRISLTYCACCINQQYIDLMNSVKNYISNKYTLERVTK